MLGSTDLAAKEYRRAVRILQEKAGRPLALPLKRIFSACT